ncbi:hypothetical protein V5O48_010900, partial [Marasmius crinis-equi]
MPPKPAVNKCLDVISWGQFLDDFNSQRYGFNVHLETEHKVYNMFQLWDRAHTATLTLMNLRVKERRERCIFQKFIEQKIDEALEFKRAAAVKLCEGDVEAFDKIRKVAVPYILNAVSELNLGSS